jgi:predicted glycosyltransferase
LRNIELADRVAVAERAADLLDLLRETTAVIGQSSKMLYEASILGRPVIVPHYDATPHLLDLPPVDRDHIVARTKRALRQKVERALDGHGRTLTIAAIAPHHPHATQRVVERLDGVRKRLERGP